MTHTNATRITMERLTVERIVVEQRIEVTERPKPQGPPSHGRRWASAPALVTEARDSSQKALLPPRDGSGDSQ